MPHTWIAEAEGITPPTLYRHYRVELTSGMRGHLQAIRAAMVRSAMKGNVSAAKFLAERPPEDMNWPTRRPANNSPVAANNSEPVLTIPPAPPPVGKKAAANEAAKTAQVGTGWADLLDDAAGPAHPLQ